MASDCFNLWRVHENSKGQKKWINEGRAPDGACPSCPESNFPTSGSWDGVSAKCDNGKIVKLVADGMGGRVVGDILVPFLSPRAQIACNGDLYTGEGPITNYF